MQSLARQWLTSTVHTAFVCGLCMRPVHVFVHVAISYVASVSTHNKAA